MSAAARNEPNWPTPRNTCRECQRLVADKLRAEMNLDDQSAITDSRVLLVRHRISPDCTRPRETKAKAS